MSLLLSAALLLGATVYDDTFVAGNRAYEEGDFSTAVREYEKLVDARILRPEVFYNLGNAYYRMGKLGYAIGNYERALAFDPGFSVAAANLEQALGDTERHLAKPLPPSWEQSLLFWHYHMSPGLTRWLAAMCWLAFWLLLALRQWRAYRFLRGGVIVAGILAAAFAGSAWMKAHPAPLAVAAEERVPVRFGRSDNETVRFELYEGDRVTVEQRERGWARVATVGGERGWAREEALFFVGPPYSNAQDSGEERL